MTFPLANRASRCKVYLQSFKVYSLSSILNELTRRRESTKNLLQELHKQTYSRTECHCYFCFKVPSTRDVHGAAVREAVVAEVAAVLAEAAAVLAEVAAVEFQDHQKHHRFINPLRFRPLNGHHRVQYPEHRHQFLTHLITQVSSISKQKFSNFSTIATKRKKKLKHLSYSFDFWKRQQQHIDPFRGWWSSTSWSVLN